MPPLANPQRMLRNALLANAAFSALSALLCLAASRPIAAWIGLSAGAVLSVGIELAVFAALLAALGTRPDLGRGWIQATVAVVIALDVLWVIGSALALLAPEPLTMAGRWSVGLIALAVADLAFFQALGWRRLRAAAASRSALGAPAAAR